MIACQSFKAYSLAAFYYLTEKKIARGMPASLYCSEYGFRCFKTIAYN
ncbi:hypothetical protein PNIG_a3579 [Pseudoalteromonas nigrifaciens]|uniref:Orphan protein n=2 Tax=Pseudoalteromonas TaxID=53246 RepID=Q3IJL6_PSET1|nr:hypothetical protein PNIG_a3579 [Pseudoalteromonas nigrifaciens]CAI87860.1 putative orphan protein [Pseudoalteromonas translucida]